MEGREEGTSPLIEVDMSSTGFEVAEATRKGNGGCNEIAQLMGFNFLKGCGIASNWKFFYFK